MSAPFIKLENAEESSGLAHISHVSSHFGDLDSPASFMSMSDLMPSSTTASVVDSSEILLADPDMGLQDDENDGAGAKTTRKPTKKRKSWGQVLPEPKTCLPPR